MCSLLSKPRVFLEAVGPSVTDLATFAGGAFGSLQVVVDIPTETTLEIEISLGHWSLYHGTIRGHSLCFLAPGSP